MNDYEIKNLKSIYEYLSECTVLLKNNGDFPLKHAGDIALYGNGARKTIKGGTGSGEVNSRFFVNIEDGLKNKGFNIKTTDWLDKYDIEYNKMKKRFKKHLKSVAKEKKQALFIASMGEVMLEGEYDIPIDVRCDNAIYVLSRISGEGADRKEEKGDIYLTDTEIRDIKYLENNYKHFMLVLNTCGVVDLSKIDFVKNILLLSQLGVETGNVFADILLGKYNPSGKLSTTWARIDDYQKIGDFGNKDDTRYKEGIYVGYRYFDTFNKDVLFPFGFGLSYTDFEYNVVEYSVNNKEFNIKVNVRNIGKYAGKEVIEVYISKPNDRLDFPYQELIAFEKTELIEPSGECELNISFGLESLKSYDYDNRRYQIIKGEYIVRVGNSSRNNAPIYKFLINNDISIKKVKNLFKKPDFEDYIPRLRSDNYNIPTLEIDEGLFDEEIVNYELRYEVLDEIKKLSDNELMKLNMGRFNEKGGIKSIIGSSGISVPGAAGETAKIDGLDSIVMADGPQGLRLARDYFVDKNGPHSKSGLIPESMKEYMPLVIRGLLYLLSPKPRGNEIMHQYTTALPIATAVAQSFNKKLGYVFGDIVGSEMELFNVNLWLAPALNIHRSILCGRNFEYYSEDPYLSGIMAKNVVLGVESHKGCGATIKHFLCNNQEYNRYVNNSIVSERAIRDIYLKGFEIVIKEAKPKAVMTSYNLLNGIHTSENININEKILRCELGHDGIIMTDWIVKFMQNESKYKYAYIDRVLKAHSDIFMPGSKEDYNELEKALRIGLISRDDLEINASRLYKTIKGLRK